MTTATVNDDLDLAALAGYDDGSDASITDTSALLGDEWEEDITPQRWSNNPLIHLIFVGGCMGGIVFILALLFGKHFSQPPAPNPEPSGEPESALLTPLDGDRGRIKAQAAFGQQRDALDALDEPETNGPKSAAKSDKAVPPKAVTSASPVRQPPPPAPVARRATPRAPVTPPRPVRPTFAAVTPPPPPPQSSNPPSRPAPSTTPEVLDVSLLPTERTTPDPGEDIAALEQTEPDDAEDIEGSVLWLRPGSQVAANTTTDIAIAPSLPLRFPIQLQAPLPAMDGSPALPEGTLLMAEMVETEGWPYLAVTSVVLDNQEQSIDAGSILLLTSDGTAAGAAPTGETRRGVDLEAALLTGAAAVFDDNDVLAGTALDIARQLFEREDNEPSTAPLQTIPAGTPLRVHVNQAVPLKAPPESPPETDLLAQLIATSEAQPVSTPVLAPAQPTAEDVPASIAPAAPPFSLTVAPGHGANISFLEQGEIIAHAWLDNPAMLTMDLDAPLESGEAAVLHLNLQSDSTASSTLLSVVVEDQEGNRRLLEFEIRRTGDDLSAPEPASLHVTLTQTVVV